MTGGVLRRPKFESTINAPRQQFIDNITANLGKGLPTLKIGRALLVCGGPSIAKHESDIVQHRLQGWDIFAVNGAHDWLIERGIKPHAAILMDATDKVDSFIKKPLEHCIYYLASQTHHSLVTRLSENNHVIIWHAPLDADQMRHIGKLDPGATIMAGGLTAGLNALHVLFTLGYKKMRVYGMDSSFGPEDKDHAYKNPESKSKIHEFWFRGEKFRSTGTYAIQAETFCKHWVKYHRIGIQIHVVGDGLLPAMWRAQRDTELELMKQLKEAENGGRGDVGDRALEPDREGHVGPVPSEILLGQALSEVPKREGGPGDLQGRRDGGDHHAGPEQEHPRP